jgi:pimeloyl-ACP methyl ester carboxylesterase
MPNALIRQEEFKMARAEIDGIGIDYELIGTGRTISITPGGRFSKNDPGVRELAEALAAGGFRALIWDRPNCGASDIAVRGESESALNADVLAGLIRKLDLGPTILAGGSAGSRVSLLTATRQPEAAGGLFLWWITGGAIGLAALVGVYCGDAALTAVAGGMEAVAAMPAWREQLERNPGNRARLLEQDPAAFIDTMSRWADAFTPIPGSPVPGLTSADFAALSVPVVILRSGASDLHHLRKTSEQVHALIPHSILDEPPWGDREWIDRMAAARRGEGLFANWPKLAPQILKFARTVGG